jgi:glutamine phosphoribosylpyrophosphate amidotransferase
LCAIIGFICPEPSEQAFSTLHRLFIESKIRGMHAYGYAAHLHSGATVLNKSNQLMPLLKGMARYPKLLIGHCRYSTSGDYKTEINNQPLSYKDEFLAFNGVIDMRTKAEMQAAYKIKMESDNDGEIMLQSTNRMELLNSNITYSGVVLKKNSLQFFRNESRPAYKATKFGCTYIASTADILRRCLLNPEPLNPYEVYEWTA